ncbi:MAG: GNAT family N-acetyltransferase [Lentisphaeria bacterium]|jgi:mycothiol synthase
MATRQLMMRFPVERLEALSEPVFAPDFVLRSFREGDEEAYLALMRAAGFNWADDMVQTVLGKAMPGGILFACDAKNGRLAATAMANKFRPETPDDYELGWVAAHPDYRGKRLGMKICAAVLIFYRQAGVRRVALHTDDFRKPALVTYLRLGWQPVIDDEEMATRWQAVRSELGMPATP